MKAMMTTVLQKDEEISNQVINYFEVVEIKDYFIV